MLWWNFRGSPKATPAATNWFKGTVTSYIRVNWTILSTKLEQHFPYLSCLPLCLSQIPCMVLGGWRWWISNPGRSRFAGSRLATMLPVATGTTWPWSTDTRWMARRRLKRKRLTFATWSHSTPSTTCRPTPTSASSWCYATQRVSRRARSWLFWQMRMVSSVIFIFLGFSGFFGDKEFNFVLIIYSDVAFNQGQC